MKRHFLTLGIITILCGCSESNKQTFPPDGSVFTKNFIQIYKIPSDIKLWSFSERYIAITFEGKEITNDDSGVKAQYDNLAEKYQDLSYNDYLPRYSTRAIGKEYVSIDIICNKDFDESHGAGTSLNGIVKICANSYQKFITSGYDDSFESPKLPDEFSVLGFYNGKGRYPIFKYLNEITEEDLVLFEPEIYLFFESIPVAGKYEFTISINSRDDVVSEKVIIDFE